ncbi:NAD(P)/FAD-dependent oxidoreductase [Agreia sp.]|uniref:NAD(P)/FAD-dependent oxidoreductase n=1 Tax=Agreia sp. TaxID=1872416 RepID=UPI0035BC4A86
MRRILIVGGGYAGFYTAWKLEKRLRREEAEVTIIEPRPYMTYQPFLPEVTAGSIEARHVAVSLRSHLRRTALVAGTVTLIDHAHKRVTVEMIEGVPREIEYDIIVITAGAVTRTFPIPGVAENAIGLKTVEEAVDIRDRLLTSFERAASLPQGPERRRLLTVTIVGGGFTGVEAFGEMLSLASGMLRSYPELVFSDIAFHLVEAQGRILPEVTAKPGAWVVEHLEQRGGHVHLNTQLVSASGGRIVLSSGESYDNGLLIWAAGNASNPVVANHTDLPVDARGLIQVLPDLRVVDDGDVIIDAWAAGDNAAVPDLASPVLGARTVPNAQHAVRQGKLMAKNLIAQMRGETPRDYRHQSLGTVATLGLGRGIFQYRSIVIKGLIAWVMHRGYHVLAVPTWERKLRVLLVWIAAVIFGRDIVSLESVKNPRAAFIAAATHRENQSPASVPAVAPAPLPLGLHRPRAKQTSHAR